MSRLLHLSAGVVRTGTAPTAPICSAPPGSAGGRFPLELYVAVPTGRRCPPAAPHDAATRARAGVHGTTRRSTPGGAGPPPRQRRPALVVTGIPWRTGWRYRERGYRHVYWDAGDAAQALAAAGSAGLGPRLYSDSPDAAVSELVGADWVHEWPVAVLGLGGAPALAAAGPAATGQTDAAPIEFPLDTAAQRARGRGTLGAPWDPGAPVDVPALSPRPVEDVVLTRGSQRLMDPARGLPQTLLRESFAVALRGIGLPHRIVVHDVTGLAPRASTAGPICPPRRVPVRCATSCTGCAWTRRSAATPRSSLSPRPTWPPSTTGPTARPTWPLAWPRAGLYLLAYAAGAAPALAG